MAEERTFRDPGSWRDVPAVLSEISDDWEAELAYLTMEAG